jgi:polyphosphate glucokinase
VSTQQTTDLAFGIDIGGTGMKAAIVDLASGELASDRFRIDTPQPATPEAMADVVGELVEHHGWSGSVGCAFPAVVRRGVVGSAANIDKSWLDIDADALFTKVTGLDVHMINDADAAGLAEVRYGAAARRDGVVLLLTLGTGIGSALLVDGVLVPNTELGHLELDGPDVETRTSAAARKREGLGWKEWSGRVQRYLEHVEAIFSPELIILGGGVTKRADRWFSHLDVETELVIATMLNNAGIVGAAMVAPS